MHWRRLVVRWLPFCSVALAVAVGGAFAVSEDVEGEWMPADGDNVEAATLPSPTLPFPPANYYFQDSAHHPQPSLEQTMRQHELVSLATDVDRYRVFIRVASQAPFAPSNTRASDGAHIVYTGTPFPLALEVRSRQARVTQEEREDWFRESHISFRMALPDPPPPAALVEGTGEDVQLPRHLDSYVRSLLMEEDELTVELWRHQDKSPMWKAPTERVKSVPVMTRSVKLLESLVDCRLSALHDHLVVGASLDGSSAEEQLEDRMAPLTVVPFVPYVFRLVIPNLEIPQWLDGIGVGTLPPERDASSNAAEEAPYFLRVCHRDNGCADSPRFHIVNLLHGQKRFGAHFTGHGYPITEMISPRYGDRYVLDPKHPELVSVVQCNRIPKHWDVRIQLFHLQPRRPLFGWKWTQRILPPKRTLIHESDDKDKGGSFGCTGNGRHGKFLLKWNKNFPKPAELGYYLEISVRKNSNRWWSGWFRSFQKVYQSAMFSISYQEGFVQQSETVAASVSEELKESEESEELEELEEVVEAVEVESPNDVDSEDIVDALEYESESSEEQQQPEQKE